MRDLVKPRYRSAGWRNPEDHSTNLTRFQLWLAGSRSVADGPAGAEPAPGPSTPRRVDLDLSQASQGSRRQRA